MIADPSLSAGLDRVEETLVLVALFVTEQCDLVFVASTFVIMHEISFLWYTSDLFVAEFDFLLMSLLLWELLLWIPNFVTALWLLGCGVSFAWVLKTLFVWIFVPVVLIGLWLFKLVVEVVLMVVSTNFLAKGLVDWRSVLVWCICSVRLWAEMPYPDCEGPQTETILDFLDFWVLFEAWEAGCVWWAFCWPFWRLCGWFLFAPWIDASVFSDLCGFLGFWREAVLLLCVFKTWKAAWQVLRELLEDCSGALASEWMQSPFLRMCLY